MLVTSNYGTIGCSEFDIVLGRLEAALAEAERVGATGTGAYKSAKQFHDDETGFWSSHQVAVGQTCVDLVDEGKRLIQAVNSAISTAKGTAVIVPGVSASSFLPNPGKALSDVKWITVAAAVVAGAYVFGPTIKAALGMRRAARS